VLSGFRGDQKRDEGEEDKEEEEEAAEEGEEGSAEEAEKRYNLRTVADLIEDMSRRAVWKRQEKGAICVRWLIELRI